MQKKRKAEALLLITSLIWGGTFAATKISLQDISPLFLVGVRFIFATLLILPLLFWQRKNKIQGTVVRQKSSLGLDPSLPQKLLAKKTLFSQKTWFWGLLTGLAMFIGYAGQTMGLVYTSIARSGFITYSFALYVPLLQFFLLRRRPSLGNLFGLFFVIWGFSFITDTAMSPLAWADMSPLRILTVIKISLQGGLNKGDLYSLAGAIGYAFYIVLVDYATRSYHPNAIIAIQMLFCGMLSLGLAPWIEDIFLIPTWSLAASFLYLVIPGGLVVMLLTNWFQRHVTPLRATLIYAFEPICAAFTAYLLFHDSMSSRELMGAGFILLAIFISDFWASITRKSPRRRKNNLAADSF